MKLIHIAILFLLAAGPVYAEVGRASELYKTLKAQDSLLFTVGFNTCDIRQFEEIVSDDFEFYHDQSGMTSGKDAFIAGIQNGLCTLPYKPRRQLIDSSLKVYPLKKNGVLYGAIQTGEHLFYATERDKPEYLTSAARFTHVWLIEQGMWKLSRGLSYDHHKPESTDSADESLLFKDRTETEQWLAQKRIPALGIGYMENGAIREVVVYGRNEKGGNNPENTIFNVASLTKPVTATVVLKLVDAGAWSLDEPISTYWTDPDIAGDPRSRQLTTRHILSHRSGFPNWRRENPDGKLGFQFTPGTAYQYSGEGFEYLRKALEHTFKKTLDELVEELIFRPLGMDDTYFHWQKGVDESRFAAWHKADGSLYPTYKNTSANAADDLLTTVEDYSKLMLHIMNGAGLNTDLYRDMTSEQIRIKPRKYWGLGWWIDEGVDNGANALVHGGDDMGVHTIAFLLPGSGRGLIIFTNCDNGTEVYIPVIQHYLGKVGQEIIDVETK